MKRSPISNKATLVSIFLLSAVFVLIAMMPNENDEKHYPQPWYELYPDPDFQGTPFRAMGPDGEDVDDFEHYIEGSDNSWSSAKVHGGYLVLYEYKNQQGDHWILKVDGGNNGRGAYPNLNGYGEGCISSTEFWKKESNVPAQMPGRFKYKDWHHVESTVCTDSQFKCFTTYARSISGDNGCTTNANESLNEMFWDKARRYCGSHDKVDWTKSSGDIKSDDHGCHLYARIYCKCGTLSSSGF